MMDNAVAEQAPSSQGIALSDLPDELKAQLKDELREEIKDELAYDARRLVKTYFDWGMRVAGMKVNHEEFISTFKESPEGLHDVNEAVDVETAWPLSRCCEISYLGKNQIEELITQLEGAPEFHWIEENKVEHTQGFIIVGKTYVLVVFRGTQTDVPAEQFRDLRTDSKIRKVLFHDDKSWGEVHRGFYRAHQAIWPQVWEIVKHHQDKKIWFTGHSLGGAIATMGFAEMCYRDDAFSKQSHLCTFGQPRVGSQTFKDKMAAHAGRIYRFVKNNDPITFVPFYSIGYRHLSKARYIDRKNRFRSQIGKASIFWDRIVSGVWTVGVLTFSHISRIGVLAKNFTRVNSIIDDHNMGNYALSLEDARTDERVTREGSGSESRPYLPGSELRLNKQVTLIICNQEGRPSDSVKVTEVAMEGHDELKGYRLSFDDAGENVKTIEDESHYRRLTVAHRNSRRIYVNLPMTFWYHEHELDEDPTGELKVKDLLHWMSDEEELQQMKQFDYEKSED